jgi:uracil-DNA glycosylase family 4
MMLRISSSLRDAARARNAAPIKPCHTLRATLRGVSHRDLDALSSRITRCRSCARLVRCRERAVREPPRRFATLPYWGRAVPGFGDPAAGLLVVGLAPAAHGANRTGRVFTGDRSGEWLYRALHRAGWANQPTSTAADDGLALAGAYVTCVVRCAPPGNKPSPAERDRCRRYLVDELRQLARVRAIVALGAFAWDGVLRAAGALGHPIPRPRPAFGHGARAALGPYAVFGCYHVSQQNTFTGRLTSAMIDRRLERARGLVSTSRRLG